MKVVLELDNTVQVGVDPSNPYTKTLEARWKVVSHDFAIPKNINNVGLAVHHIKPIKPKKQYTKKHEWVTVC